MLQGRLCGNTVVILSVANLAVSMLILDENSLVCEVTGKGNSRNSKTREGALEAVPAGEWAGVSPCLTVGRRLEMVDRTRTDWMRRTIWPMGPLRVRRTRQQTWRGRSR